MIQIEYSAKYFYKDALELAYQIKSRGVKYNGIYGVPRGGVPLAVALSGLLNLPLCNEDDLYNFCFEDGEKKYLIIDDVVDSGATRERFKTFDFACIHLKKQARYLPTYSLYKGVEAWISYFWEEETGDKKGNNLQSIKDSVLRQLQYIGEDANREGLKDTPDRVVRMWDSLFSGYSQSISSTITVFEAEGCDEIILLRDIEFYSTCEHHLLPFFGKAHIAYIPDKKIIGVSKLARILEIFTRRIQIQERIGNQVTDALQEYLKPKAAACILEAKHLCMIMRGVQKQNSIMVTSSLKGAFLDDDKARKELMDLCGVGR